MKSLAPVRLSKSRAARMGYDVSEIAEAPIYRLSIPQGSLEWDVYDPENTKSAFCVLCIGVKPRFRRKGYARQLLTRLAAIAKREGREVSPGAFTEDGEHLRALCVRLGFQIEENGA